ncbi:MAG: hypothetical protein PWQ60_2595 [Thermoanaerobacteraceae bacterium]|nr:hypothetical protein [Thermoanaerobacteraceae bacterium]
MEEILKKILEKVDGIENSVTELKEGQKRLEERQAKLEEGQKRLEERQVKLEEGQKEIRKELKFIWDDIKKIDNRLIAQEKITSNLNIR